MVLEKKCLKLFKYIILRHTNWSKITLVNRKYVTVTKLCYKLFLIFTILNTYVSLIFHAKIQPKLSSGSEEDDDLVILLFLVTVVILDI